MNPKDYDGFYILPDEENDLQIAYFLFKDEFANSKPIESTTIGDKYHIAFFRRDANGQPFFEESFEAILGDPSVYAKNLVGAGIYGCILRKTEKSTEWFEEYLKRALKKITIFKMKNYLESIIETK
jgi:hypothetical protein